MHDECAKLERESTAIRAERDELRAQLRRSATWLHDLMWLENNAPIMIWTGSRAGKPRIEIYRGNPDGTAADDENPLGCGANLRDAIEDARERARGL
jgi:hypothetical protein